MTFTSINDWGLSPEGERTIIAGPCSAESLEQVKASFAGAINAGAHILRAGIWKPRTRPGNFEGLGEKALTWISEISRELDAPVCIEVATPSHIEQAIKYRIDAVWIGARSTVNPFVVQELASALRGTDMPVFVKNPVNPDLGLWIGAIERFATAGSTRIAAVHRGFSLAHASPYRNIPLWEIPVELKRRYPSLPLICDPSHIAGSTTLIRDVAQRAYDLNMDGLMLETHHQPGEALTDAAQQLTPAQLKAILNSLINRHQNVADPDFLANLEALRYDLDSLDQEVIELLSKRMEVAREIGRYKKRSGVTILQQERWENTFTDRVNKASNLGLDQDFAERLISLIHQESIRQQHEIMNTIWDGNGSHQQDVPSIKK